MRSGRPPGSTVDLLAASLLLFLLLLAAAGCGAAEDGDAATNRLTDLRVCAIPVDGVCSEDLQQLPVDVDEIHVSATVEDPVPGTEARATLTRVDGPEREKILSYSVGIEPDEDSGAESLSFFFSASGNNAGAGDWIAGEYEIELVIHAAGAQPVTKIIKLVED